LAAFIILFRAIFPPVGEVVEAGIEHSLRDVRGRRGIMEDAWLEAAEGVGPCEGSQGVLFLPTHIIIQFLEVGQIFGQVSDVIVGPAEALHFRAKGIVSFLLDGEVDHGCEGFPREEGICFLACEDPSGIRIFSRSEGARMTGAVTPPREEELRVVREEVVPVEGGVNQFSSQPWNGVVMSRGRPFNATVPVLPGYDSELFDDFGGRCVWMIVEIQGG
jgi:hypothetical protein